MDISLYKRLPGGHIGDIRTSHCTNGFQEGALGTYGHPTVQTASKGTFGTYGYLTVRTASRAAGGQGLSER